MKITDRERFRQRLSERYARDIEGLNDEDLIAEALATIEAVFSYMDEEDVFKRSRPYAVSYLALCAAQEQLSKI
jgi:prophage maintenance system killer protein